MTKIALIKVGNWEIKIEKADIFSSYLLLPEEGIIGLIPELEKKKKNLISTETIFKIQQYYSVSINALIHRLIELGFVDKN